MPNPYFDIGLLFQCLGKYFFVSDFKGAVCSPYKPSEPIEKKVS